MMREWYEMICGERNVFFVEIQLIRIIHKSWWHSSALSDRAGRIFFLRRMWNIRAAASLFSGMELYDSHVSCIMARLHYGREDPRTKKAILFTMSTPLRNDDANSGAPENVRENAIRGNLI